MGDLSMCVGLPVPSVSEHDTKMAEVDDDEPINEFKHGRMLEAIHSIDGKKRLMAAQRTEYAAVSEYSLSSKKKVNLNDLLGTLGKTARLSTVRVKTKKYASKDVKTIPVPLDKLEVSKIGRVVTYENVCKEVSKWDRVVFQNRAAEQVVYPLNQPDLRLETGREVVKRFKSATPLEMEIATLLESRRPAVTDPSPDERKARVYRADLDEALEMRRDMQIMRARQSYREAKARYQKRIKSKRYHRILKKERTKKEAKEFESLQKTNPELAQEKLDKLDRQRIVERMTLRHRNTGKWAREQIIKFKNDKESGRAVQEQIELGRHLAAKLHNPSDSDDDDDDVKTDALNDELTDGRDLVLSQADASNPWMKLTEASPLKLSANEDDARQELLVGFKKLWEADAKKRVLEAKKNVTDAYADADADESNLMQTVDNRMNTKSTLNTAKPTKKLRWKDQSAHCNDEQVSVKQSSSIQSVDAAESNSAMKAKKAKRKLEPCETAVKCEKLKPKTNLESNGTGEKRKNPKSKAKLESNGNVEKSRKLKSKPKLDSSEKVQKSKKQKSKTKRESNEQLTNSKMLKLKTEPESNGNVEKGRKLKSKENRDSSGKTQKSKTKRESNGKLSNSKKLKSKTKATTGDAFVTNDEDGGVDEVDQIFQEAAVKKTKEIKKSKKVTKKPKKEDHVVPVLSEIGSSDANDELINETLVRKRLWEDFDRPTGQNNDVSATDEAAVESEPSKPASTRVLKNDKATSSASRGNALNEDVAVDPAKFISIKPRTIHCGVPDEGFAYDDDAMDDCDERQERDEQRMSIAEAFADDDVAGEFRTEKLSAVEGNKLKDVDLTLPGWGDWGGKGLAVSKRKRDRFIIKAPKGPPRKDRDLGHVILSETAESVVKPLQVGKVPFPFQNAKDFEKSLAIPIGKQWNSETAFRRLIAPKVVTKMGTIIEPIDADYLKNLKTSTKSTLKKRQAAASKRSRPRNS